MRYEYYVFYANRFYGRVTPEHLRMELLENEELRNGCYIYGVVGAYRGWHRGDLTPLNEEDVPKPIRTLLLLAR